MLPVYGHVSSVDRSVVCFMGTRKILGFYISVFHSSRWNVLKERWDSVSQNCQKKFPDHTTNTLFKLGHVKVVIFSGGLSGQHPWEELSSVWMDTNTRCWYLDWRSGSDRSYIWMDDQTLLVSCSSKCDNISISSLGEGSLCHHSVWRDLGSCTWSFPTRTGQSSLHDL